MSINFSKCRHLTDVIKTIEKHFPKCDSNVLACMAGIHPATWRCIRTCGNGAADITLKRLEDAFGFKLKLPSKKEFDGVDPNDDSWADEEKNPTWIEDRRMEVHYLHGLYTGMATL